MIAKMMTTSSHSLFTLTATTLLAVFSAPASTAMPQGNRLDRPEKLAGWELLFDGSDAFGLRGYKLEGMPEEGWVVFDGELRHHAGVGGGDLVTRRTYRDFDFRFQWKVAEGGNSGVIYRVSEDHAETYETGPEYQILDDSAHPDLHFATGAGALYGLYTSSVKPLRGPGMWNEGRVVVIGDHIEHWLNGERVVEVSMHDEAWKRRVAETKFKDMPDFGMRASGHIALQAHGDDVWYRGLKVLSLDPSQDKNLQALEGTNLNGWASFEVPGEDQGAGAGAEWTFENGELSRSGPSSGYLHTGAEFQNFGLTVECRVDPDTARGQSGALLLRRIGPHQASPRCIALSLVPGQAGDLVAGDGFPMHGPQGRSEGARVHSTAPDSLDDGQWHKVEVTCWQSHVVVRIDDAIVNQAAGCMEAPGHLALQATGPGYRFRDLNLYRLGLDGYKGMAQKRLGNR